MGIKKGTKLTDTPKNLVYYIRVDKETDEKTKEIMKRDNISKSEAVRRGIELQYNKLQRKVDGATR